MEYVFTDEEMSYVLDLLVDRPFKESAPLIQKIQHQYDLQMRIKQEQEIEKEGKQRELDENKEALKQSANS